MRPDVGSIPGGEIMYVYIRTEPQLWTVGFYSPNGHWEPESDWDSPEKAAERVHYLNGNCGGSHYLPSSAIFAINTNENR